MVDGAGVRGSVGLDLLLVVGAGLVEGLALGSAQAWNLRRWLPRLRRARFVAATVLVARLAWPPVMVTIFAGASLPGEDWSPAAVVDAGAATGAVAGGLLGLTTYWALGSMTTVPLWDRVLLRLLGSSWGWLDGDLVGVEVRGRRTGWTYRMPVRYAVDLEGALVVVPRDGTSWWRNVHRSTTAVEVLWQGEWPRAYAEPLVPGHPDHEEAWATYSLRWPRAPACERGRAAGAGVGRECRVTSGGWAR